MLSPIPHGIVKRIDASRAEALPGVVKVFSHENSPMDSLLPGAHPPRAGPRPHDETLFSEHVRFVGDRVAAVVATSRATAEAAAALVEVEYDELPPLLTLDEALARDDVPIHSGGNVVYEHEIDRGERPDLEGAADRLHLDHHAARPSRRARAARLHRPGPQHRRHDRLDHEPGRLRRAHGHRRAARAGVPPRARHQGAHGRLVRRQDRVHPRAGLRLSGARDRAGPSSSCSTARSA